jgi:hypothetical protein
MSRVIIVSGFTSGLALCGIMATMTAADPNDEAAAKVGSFSTVEIDKKGMQTALDIHLDGKGRAVRFYATTVEGDPIKDPRTYFNDSGMLYTNGWIIISGVSSGTGEGFNIEPPTLDTSMLAIWSDVLGPAIQVRSANAGADSYIFQALDKRANYTFSIEQDGGLRWGAALREDMDTNLYRSTAKTLQTDGSLVVAGQLGIGGPQPTSTLHVDGSQSVRRTAVAADYTLTDTDYYVGVSDTSVERTLTLPTASGKPGRIYVIKDESGGAGTHRITVKAPASETIDGAGELFINANYGVLRMISSGESWFGM